MAIFVHRCLGSMIEFVVTMLPRPILLLVVVCVSLCAAHPYQKTSGKAACGYNACAAIDPNKLNVHMIPHTHDDVGWIKTFDQLYYGARNDVQKLGGAQYILDSVVKALLANPTRRFIYVETAFLNRWWKEQTEEKRDQFRGLVNSGQLEIANGAWSSNDEGATHYQSIIDQFTWGFRVLNESLGECGRPTVGWQVDTYGHARGHASLNALLGFDGLFFGRFDYQDRRNRMDTKTAETIWRASPDNLGDIADIFTHAFETHYSAPPGFCFDIICGDDPMIDNPASTEYNIPDRVRNFVDHVKNKATKYRTNNVLVTMGDDFMYQEAGLYFKNMDKLVKYVNADTDSNVNLFYSTPSCYLKAVNDAGITWPEKTDDFFPYASEYQTYWVGYYTSMPTLKYFERLSNNFLQVSKQLLVQSGVEDQTGLTVLREAMGVLQHHDAITGTMKLEVQQNYYNMLNWGIAQTAVSAAEALTGLFSSSAPPVLVVNCLKLNISECAATEGADNFVVTAYNPLSRPVAEYIRVPVTVLDLQVQAPDGSVIPSEIIDLPDAVLLVPGRDSAATSELVFRADSLPPLGFQSFYVSQAAGKNGGEPKRAKPEPRATTIGNENVIVNIDDNGLTTSITINGIDVSLAHTFEYYISSDQGGDRGELSNAYIFRPNGTDTIKVDITGFKVVRTPLVEEVHQEFGNWISQVIRVYAGENHVEFEWMVGPIPDGDGISKEVVSKFSTDLATDATFYTDANGREILKRVRNFRPTWDVDLTDAEKVASNFYPVVSKILIRDEAQGVEVAVLVDRSEGGTSLQDGAIELLVHRRILRNNELNEVTYGVGTVARGKHWLVAGPIAGEGTSVAAQERLLQTGKLLKPWTFVSPASGVSQEDWAALYNVEYSGLTGSGLPANVQILTLEPWTPNTLLLRLEHILEVNEDAELSQPATIDLTATFSFFTINSAVETTMGGIQPIEELNRMQWNPDVKRERQQRENKAIDITAVTLNPMESRTIVLDITLV